MIGANVKKMIKNKDGLCKLFADLAVKHQRSTISRLHKVLLKLMESWKTLYEAMSKHNEKPFSDDYIKTLQQQLAVFQLYLDKLVRIRGKPDSKGTKHHLLTHAVEFMEYYRFSTSYVDDQRQEAMHPLVRRHAFRYKRYNTKGQLEAMIKSMNNKTLNNC